jgi:outer membrane protein, heavy metal efflux system
MSRKTLTVLIWIALSLVCQAQQNTTQYVSDTQGITFQELAQTALSRNKEIEAARESLRQSQARLTQARLRPNPSLEVSRTTDAMFGNEGDRAFSVTYSQPLELGGKRSKRISVEEAGIELTKAEIADKERLLIGELRSLYVQAMGAASRLDLFDRLNGLNEQMVKVMDVRLRAGDASRLDARLLAAETNQVRAQRLVAANQLTGAILQIRAIAGLSITEPVLLKRTSLAAGPEESEEATVQRALENRPDLKAAKFREDLADAGITLAKSQAVPTPTAFARYGRESIPIVSTAGQPITFDRENVMEFGVSLPLPFFNREQGNIAEAASKRTQARSEREALEIAIRREVVLAYQRFITARQTLQILQTGVIQPNQESFQIVQLAYRLGEMRLLDIVNQQRFVVEAETNYADAQTEFNAALADLELATATVTDP